ncbi:BREX system P-loop protein BrxC [Micromonospora sp. CPCC 205371]|nr:BREX system P-loop protein BrxC [Micromonospora sp. CPCC 205371]
MTITNRELFHHDPTETKIPNDGVAKVVRPETDQQWDVLRWELRSFVCDGQYSRGLERILDSFLINLSQAQQPAVWVSGFYGSGKSHLVRVLEHLWRDVELPTRERARDLVTLPEEVRDHLTELSTAGKRLGGLWSAAGTLAAGKSDAVRLAFLSVLFASAGLPEEYARARFVIWARENDYLDAVRTAVEAEGRTFSKEIHDLYVSPVIAKALLVADPTLGDSVKDVRDLLRTQFPPTAKDVTDDEMFDVVDDVLRLQSTSDGKLPLTLVVLDEMQQYIGDDNEKALAVQNIAEGCSARFKSQILFVATGQSALTATPTLQKLTDRFTVPVALSDKDVETVVREVVLRKKPECVPRLKSTLDSVSGEIDKHLGGTQLAPKAADKPDLVPDYPLLPTRRRFWELALRAIDRAGKAGVLRTQLRIVHEAAARVAGKRVGHVVGADFLYDEQSPGMLQSGVLLKEIDELIRSLRSDGRDGELKSRICALTFLISQIPARTISGETGLRATSPFLADFLVEDLADDGARLRKRVPELLDELVSEGRLMRIDDEYRLQTEEGAEWEKDYRSRLAVVRDDATRLNQLRSERLSAAVDTALGGLKLTHGASKTPRRIHVHWGQDEPVRGEGDVPVWVRDEWSVTESTVKRAAAEAGDESPIVFVLLPKHEVDQIKETLASHAAAEETLRRPTPQTDEGRAAQRAMQTRLTIDDERLTTLFQGVVARARVFQGGGAEVTTSNLGLAVETAANRSLIRLFPKFRAGDNANWSKVVTKAREGAPDALDAVGHHGEPTTNVVCKEVLAAISPGGTKGTELQKRFAAPPFGWPKDAVNGAIFTLIAAGNVRAVLDGKDLAGTKELPPNQIGKVALYKEDEPPTVGQRLAVKGLLAAAGIPYEAGQEGAQLSALLQRIKDLASRAGGSPPLPERPDTDHLDALLALGGNQRFRAVADDHDHLSSDLDRWRAADQRREKRESEWHDLLRLLRHADGLSVATSVLPGVAAVRDGRQLLDDPNPLALLLAELTTALRHEVTRLAEQLADAQRQAIADLEAWGEWAKLDPADRDAIIADAKLVAAKAPDLGTEAKLLEALDSTPLNSWQDRISLVPGRRDQARQRAAKLLEPESVAITAPSATIKDNRDLDSYLETLRVRVQPHLDAHKTVII